MGHRNYLTRKKKQIIKTLILEKAVSDWPNFHFVQRKEVSKENIDWNFPFVLRQTEKNLWLNEWTYFMEVS